MPSCSTDPEGFPFDPAETARLSRLRLARDYLQIRKWHRDATSPRDLAYYGKHKDVAFKLLSKAMEAEATLYVDDVILRRDVTGDITVLERRKGFLTEDEKRAKREARKK